MAILLAFAGLLLPGLHKFYLRQYTWGLVYVILGVLFPAWAIARVASVIEAVWYLLQGQASFDQHFNAEFIALVPSLNVESVPTPIHAPSHSLGTDQLLRQGALK